MIFNEHVKYVGFLQYRGDTRQIKQLFRASPEFAIKKGGFIYEKLIKLLPFKGLKYISIDSRVHMLMKGMYPCIPGWHCDDFWRPDNDQPDLENVPTNMTHWSVNIGTCSNTEFIDGPIELPSPTELWEVYPNDRPLYSYYNEIIENKKPKINSTWSGEIYQFDGRVFHRGTPAKYNGWRAFIRVTESDHYEPKNEIRTQTQVYLTEPFLGW